MGGSDVLLGRNGDLEIAAGRRCRDHGGPVAIRASGTSASGLVTGPGTANTSRPRSERRVVDGDPKPLIAALSTTTRADASATTMRLRAGEPMGSAEPPARTRSTEPVSAMPRDEIGAR